MHDRAREGRGGVSALLRYLYYPLSVTSSYDCISYVVVVQQGFTFGALVVVVLVDDICCCLRFHRVLNFFSL